MFPQFLNFSNFFKILRLICKPVLGYHQFMKRPPVGKKIFSYFLVVSIISSIHSPLYHDHADINSSSSKQHHHSSHEYSISIDLNELKKEIPLEKPHQEGYHAHFKKDHYRNGRTYTNKVKTYDFGVLSNFFVHSPSVSKHSYPFNDPVFLSKYIFNTSSGLSPPCYPA